MTLRFLPQAEAELVEAISYYSAIDPELGSRFEQAAAEAARKSAAGVSFGIVYRADGDGVLIVAVAHERKKPEYWAGRM